MRLGSRRLAQLSGFVPPFKPALCFKVCTREYGEEQQFSFHDCGYNDKILNFSNGNTVVALKLAILYTGNDEQWIFDLCCKSTFVILPFSVNSYFMGAHDPRTRSS